LNLYNDGDAQLAAASFQKLAGRDKVLVDLAASKL